MIEFINIFVTLFFEMALYLMIGLFFVGILYIFVSKESISKQLGKKNFWSVVKASLIGVPLPLCSCGVVPSAVYLSRNGASKGAVISFLTSTPQTGVDSIIATYGMMGPIFAIYRPLAALIMGVVGGMFVQNIKDTQTDAIHEVLSDVSADDEMRHKTFWEKVKAATKYSFVEFLDDISPQFIFGLFIAALITFFVPDSFFENTRFSSGILGMLLMVAVGAPMYVCATASIPIAVSLILKGFSPGVAFVFLVVGPATNAASFTILLKVLGKKTAIAYLLVLITLSIILGYVLDYIFAVFSLDAKSMIPISHQHLHNIEGMDWTSIIFGSIFLVLILSSLYRLYLRKYFIKIEEIPNMTTLKITGMNCNHCVANVTKAISSIEGIETVTVDLPTETARIDGKFDMEALKKKIEDVGYKVEDVKF